MIKKEYYLCRGCYDGVKENNMVEFNALGVPFRICKSCAKEIKLNIEEALERSNNERKKSNGI